jgi:hypothetical protein
MTMTGTMTSDPASADSHAAGRPTATQSRLVDRCQFMEQGFAIIRGLIPPDRLESLRADTELAVERFQQQHPDEWATSAQPRLHVNAMPGLVDARNPGMAQIWCDDLLLDVAAQVLALPDPANTGMMVMCNPRRDFGPAGWHRDVHPHDMAPLKLLQDDLLENGPRYVQWNIPLYDDAVLWVVPGSHRRLNSDAENRQLAQDACKPLPGGVPVDLRAGDGVVYINYLLHWGSNYSARMRRTLHGGHAIFSSHGADEPYLSHLDARGRHRFAQWRLRGERLKDLSELALRCAIHGDTHGYEASLNGLQHGIGDAGKLTLSCYLSKVVWMIMMRAGTGIPVPRELQHLASQQHDITLAWGMAFAERFTATEAGLLGQRFAWLDQRLRAGEEQYVPGFQAGPMAYRFEEPAPPTSFRDFLASWG